MHFSLSKLGIGNSRRAVKQTFTKFSQVSHLSSQNYAVLHRHSFAPCFNRDRWEGLSLLTPRYCHLAQPESLHSNVSEENFEHPLQGLKTLSKLMEDKCDRGPIFSVDSNFDQSSNLNRVQLTLKWPQTLKFTACSREKRVALNETCREALEWLYANKFITKSIKPIMEHETSHLNTFYVNLNQTEVNQVDEVLQSYFQDIVPALSNFDRTWLHYDNDMTHLHPTLGIPYPSAEDLEKWNKTLKPCRHPRRVALPIDEFREEILQAIKNNRVTIVKGATGCGKTTKVPQFILDEAIAEGRGAYCNIAVSLPRRLTAKETAKFVSYCRRENVGQSVGYNVRMDKKLPSVQGGSITFMTGQKLALKFTGNHSLRGVSHVVLDEVHLRDIGTDITMTLLRQALEINKDLRVIIMSATVDSDLLEFYFNGAGPIPVIEVPGRTFPVQAHFLNDLPSRLISGERSQNMVDNLVEIDFNLVRKTILWIHHTKPKGGILVFVSGWSDIMELTDLLSSNKELKVIPVHRKLRDHSAALKPLLTGQRKVLLSTNVAETSITFPDIVYVVDCGIHKKSERTLVSRGRWSTENVISTWISKANAIQRRGRAGRVCPGECYHLYTEETFQQMSDHETPQILSTSLENAVMLTKMVNPKISAVDMLRNFPQPPSLSSINETVTTLKELSFLSHFDETPTALAVACMKLSAPLPSASAMVYAAIFRCLSPMVSVISSEEESPLGLAGSSEERHLKTSYHDSSDHYAKAKVASNTTYSTRTKQLQNFYERMVKGQNDIFNTLDMNEHDSDMLVKSILMKCFGSLLVRVKTPFTSYMIDSSGISAKISSRSVNYNFDKMAHPFAIYLKREGKDKFMLVDNTTTVSPLSVLLFFSGKFRIQEVDSENIQVRGWGNNYVSLILSNKDYARVLQLRRCLKDVLEYFVVTEILNFPDENFDLMCEFRKDLVDCINNMLSADQVDKTDL